MVKIFRCYDAAQDVLDCVLADGVVGIIGGRLDTRRLMSDVDDLAKAGGYEQIMVSPSNDHRNTELACIYDSEFYDSTAAQAEVIKAYGLANPTED